MHPSSTVPKSAKPFWAEGRIAKSPIRWSGSQGEGPEDSQRVPWSKVARLVGSTLNSGEAELTPCALQRVVPQAVLQYRAYLHVHASARGQRIPLTIAALPGWYRNSSVHVGSMSFAEYF